MKAWCKAEKNTKHFYFHLVRHLPEQILALPIDPVLFATQCIEHAHHVDKMRSKVG